MNKRTLEGHTFKAISYIAAAITLLALVGILGRITLEALPSLSLYFLITPESKVPGLGGGIANAIAGTLLLSLLSTALATPLAVGTAVYLKRYAKPGTLVRTFGFLLDVLAEVQFEIERVVDNGNASYQDYLILDASDSFDPDDGFITEYRWAVWNNTSTSIYDYNLTGMKVRPVGLNLSKPHEIDLSVRDDTGMVSKLSQRSGNITIP